MVILRWRRLSWLTIYSSLILSQVIGLSFNGLRPVSLQSQHDNQTTTRNGTRISNSDGTILILEPPALETRPLPPILEPDLDPTSPQQPHSIVWNTTFAPDQDGVFDHRATSPGTLGRKSKREIENSDIFTPNNVTSRNLVPRASATLRILCLGASITWGDGSSHGNGYRWGLRSALVGAGYTVNMIGSVNQGNMADNQVEGWPGAVISGVAQKAELSLPSRPNIVIIQVGSNDMTLNIDPSGAAGRMGALVDRIHEAVPESMILVSSLMPMTNTAALRLAEETYNPGLLQMVKDKKAENKNVWFIDMNNGYITLDDLADGLHPNDAGYMKMARLYYDAIVDLNYYIKPIQAVAGINDAAAPSDTGGGEIDTKCQKVPGNAIGPVVTQQGSGHGDGPYIHKGVDQGRLFVWEYDPSQPPANVRGIFWADLNGDGHDDLVYIPENFKQIEVLIAMGSQTFQPPLDITTGIDCPTPNIYFADSNDNGIDDMFCIMANGDLRIWENRPTSSLPFTNQWVASSNYDMLGKPGFPLSRVRIGDIDGDGRADYIIIHDNGDIEAWRNSGVQRFVEYWQHLGIVSSGKTFADLAGIRFVDINGDGRDDLLWISDTGQVTTWINQRGFNTGSLAPSWMPPIVTHGGPGIPGTRPSITFGKVWAPLTKNHDYIHTTTSGITPGVRVYENQGSGGRFVAGDGVFYCDMTGNGDDDYIFVSASGDFTLFGNIQSPPAWQQYGIIYHRALTSRKQLHFADWNGDGRCDILIVDKDDGHVLMARNDGFVNGKLSFYEYGLVSSTAKCGQGYGIGHGDLGVRFAHISGNPRVDYLCIEKNGRTTGYINRGINDMVYVGQIKAPVGADRGNVRFADVNGDGKDDFLWIDKFTGKTTVWTNEGLDASRPAGSAYRWQLRGVIAYGGSSRGANIYWANLHGQGRADYVINNPANNKASTYFNVCPKKPAQAPVLPPGIGYWGKYLIPEDVEDTTGEPDVTVKNSIGTTLYFTKKGACSEGQKNAIKQAYKDFHKIADTEGVKSDINWNEAATLEFFGPYVYNKDQQPQIQAVLANMATVADGWLPWWHNWIHARCDDPDSRPRCSCPLVPPYPSPPPQETTVNAYALNKSPDNSYPMINFCPRYFRKKNLEDAMVTAKMGIVERNTLLGYANQAETMFHEILHLHIGADSGGDDNNPEVEDLKMMVKIPGRQDKITTSVYEPLLCKIMARYIAYIGDPSTGYWTQRNADTYTWYAMAKYIQKKEGFYPYLPVVTSQQIWGAPWVPINHILQLDAEYPELNITGAGLDALVNPPGCSVNPDTSQNSPVILNKISPDSIYPVEYQQQRESWNKETVLALGSQILL